MRMPSNADDIAIVSSETRRLSSHVSCDGKPVLDTDSGPTRLLPGGGKIVRMPNGESKYVSARGLHDALRCGGVIVDDNPPNYQRGPSVTEQQNAAAADLHARESAR